MKLLLTNDDGIDAPGLAALEAALGGEIFVAAPHVQRSECGHQVSTRDAIFVERRDERVAAIHGTPADCVRLALRGDLFGEVDFDWILSGVNEGGNLGVDVFISGTVAAAREAAILGSRSMALSHYRRADLEIDWKLASARVERVFSELSSLTLERRGFWNVNLPHSDVAAMEADHVHCAPCRNPLPVSYRLEQGGFQYSGVYRDRQGEVDSDVSHCFGGAVSISFISL